MTNYFDNSLYQKSVPGNGGKNNKFTIIIFSLLVIAFAGGIFVGSSYQKGKMKIRKKQNSEE